MNVSSSLSTAVITALFFISGCGGGTQGTGGFDSGLPDSRLARSLSSEERQQLCDNLLEFVDSILTPDLLCPYTAFSVSIEDSPVQDGPDDCKSNEDLCRRRFDSQIAQLPAVTCPITADDPLHCDFPVALIDKCINESLEQTVNTFSKVTCNEFPNRTNFDEATRLLNSSLFSKSALCQEIEEKCGI